MENLREAALRAGVNNGIVAERFGVTRATASRWLSRNIPIPLANVKELAEILKIDPLDILPDPADRNLGKETK